jgi:hypothetical protein
VNTDIFFLFISKKMNGSSLIRLNKKEFDKRAQTTVIDITTLVVINVLQIRDDVPITYEELKSTLRRWAFDSIKSNNLVGKNCYAALKNVERIIEELKEKKWIILT